MNGGRVQSWQIRKSKCKNTRFPCMNLQRSSRSSLGNKSTVQRQRHRAITRCCCSKATKCGGLVLAKDGRKSQIQGTPTGEPKGTYYLMVNPRGQLVRTNESDQKSQTKGARLAQRDDYVLTVYADGTAWIIDGTNKQKIDLPWV
ncbi:hypothetical protein SELMODRAFT_403988 [Selaginella moellendorffii]|uniref:Uncharacterized protein n=1 Tax=Selaginella moellendorffii TaxID=88036 RepID=D8QT76_SELML|nr:hypothetical protein SELMODRAFT_403988 [Selaginella moellendorffii]